MESFPLTYFQSKSCANLLESEFWRKKKRPPKRKFLKKAIPKAETTEFGRNMMNILRSLTRWPFSNQKTAQIYENLNSRAKKKKEHQNENFQKNAITEGDTMELGEKMVHILWSLACWRFTNLRDSKFQCKRKKKKHRNENFCKMPFRRPKRWNLAEKWWFSDRVLPVELCIIEKLH